VSAPRTVRRWTFCALLLACGAGCASATRPPLTPAQQANVDECHAFAEETAPREPIHSANGGRSTVAAAPNADTFRPLFDLCLQAKDAMMR